MRNNPKDAYLVVPQISPPSTNFLAVCVSLTVSSSASSAQYFRYASHVRVFVWLFIVIGGKRFSFFFFLNGFSEKIQNVSAAGRRPASVLFMICQDLRAGKMCFKLPKHWAIKGTYFHRQMWWTDMISFNFLYGYRYVHFHPIIYTSSWTNYLFSFIELKGIPKRCQSISSGEI